MQGHNNNIDFFFFLVHCLNSLCCNLSFLIFAYLLSMWLYITASSGGNWRLSPFPRVLALGHEALQCATSEWISKHKIDLI